MTFRVALAILIFVSNCDSGAPLPIDRAKFTLENQDDHKGILVRLSDFDGVESYVITDSSGHISSFGSMTGYYAVEVVYPYFETRLDSVKIRDGVVDPRTKISLRQNLRFEVRPSSRVISLNDETVFESFGYNMRDVVVHSGSWTNHQFVGFRPLTAGWPAECDLRMRVASIDGGSPISISVPVRSPVTISVMWSDARRIAPECIVSGRAYELFIAPVDVPRQSPEKLPFFQLTGGSRAFPIETRLDLNSSIYQKRDLLRPATVYVVE